MRAFIDRELIPLEPIFDELPADEWQRRASATCRTR